MRITTMKKCELAWLYSPGVAQTTALNRLSRWMKGDRELMTKLQEMGYQPSQRVLRPEVVRTIIEYLGEPEILDP